MEKVDHSCDVLVIGAGLAGMAASLFALDKGLSAAQTGLPGESVFASGLLDLMAVHPMAEGRIWDNPWKAVEAVTADIPEHPYAKLRRADIEAAFEAVTGFLGRSGMAYKGYPERNAAVLTPVGSLKHAYRVPETMWHGVAARETGAPCLLVDFEGLKGFSARQIAETLKDSWPGLRHARIPFPGMAGDLYPEKMAFALEGETGRAALAEAVKPLLSGERYLGMPAVIGHYRPGEAHRDLEARLGVKIFEIPTMPPGVTGLRLKAAFEEHLPRKGLATFYQKLVLGVRLAEDGDFLFDLGRRETEVTVRAKSAVLATGRFFGKGLRAGRARIEETVFGLPVRQPESRTEWHGPEFLDPAGHAVNRAGVETDAWFRPLDASGAPAYPNLRAAGSILAHQDWLRMKCGAGLAIATSFAAVNSLAAR